YRMAATAPVPGDIVELGSWIGLTTCYLATACVVTGEGRVHAVDTFEGTREDGGRYPSISKFGDTTLPEFKRRIRRAGLAEHIDILKGLTTDAVHAYRGRRIRMLLIDADHAYDGVRTDFEDWSPLVAPGGLIVFHDYLMPDVARFVDNVVAARTDIAMTPGLVDPNVMAVTKRASVAPVSASASRTHAISPATSTQGGVPVSAPQHGIVSTCRAQSHPIVADREPLPRAEATNP
ncbi:MAG: class I SAM-dependent methyltransferase, partial [Phycisphaerae bacterium]